MGSRANRSGALINFPYVNGLGLPRSRLLTPYSASQIWLPKYQQPGIKGPSEVWVSLISGTMRRAGDNYLASVRTFLFIFVILICCFPILKMEKNEKNTVYRSGTVFIFSDCSWSIYVKKYILQKKVYAMMFFRKRYSLKMGTILHQIDAKFCPFPEESVSWVL